MFLLSSLLPNTHTANRLLRKHLKNLTGKAVSVYHRILFVAAAERGV